VLLVDDGPEPVELAPVQQQLAAAVGIVAAVHLGVVVGGDVHGHEPCLAVVDAGVGVGELHVRGPQRLHLAAPQHHPGLDGLEHLVVPPGAAVGGDELGSWAGLGAGHGDPAGYR
jgi:hypothetical protein